MPETIDITLCPTQRSSVIQVKKFIKVVDNKKKILKYYHLIGQKIENNLLYPVVNYYYNYFPVSSKIT
ncbi:MAG: hypothetical protein AB1422_18960 [bacterium]